MKRIQAAIISQTLKFTQKNDSILSRESILNQNRAEVNKYKALLGRNKTRYKIDEENEEDDGSITLKIRKEYNNTAPLGNYLD